MGAISVMLNALKDLVRHPVGAEPGRRGFGLPSSFSISEVFHFCNKFLIIFCIFKWCSCRVYAFAAHDDDSKKSCHSLRKFDHWDPVLLHGYCVHITSMVLLITNEVMTHRRDRGQDRVCDRSGAAVESNMLLQLMTMTVLL